LEESDLGELHTLETLIELEPRLKTLHEAAGLAKIGQEFQGQEAPGTAWKSFFRPCLLALVGWYRMPKHPVLSSCEAYDAAFEAIYGTLFPGDGHEEF